ncbi:MAG: MarR family winged helix-turn-helix transcriptional regulator [Oscillospiraceae bacterium]|jgi:DNA-binding MarR family transcriptional regulator|nr:MarR family winged helix-turn-helix transcriptional regulator [Oscillospiraceae bacterium]
MTFSEAMNYFYFRASILELRALNVSDYTLGISYHSMLYLNVIASIENCTVSRLAELMQITKSGATLKVNDLVKHGFVTRTQSAEDGRVFFLTLTPKIAEVYEKFNNMGADMERDLQAKYSAREMELFAKMLCDVSDYEWGANNGN